MKSVINLRKINSVRMFKDLIKVQINPETHNVHLAIRISENHVHNLILELEEAMQFSLNTAKRWGNGEWDIQKLKIMSKYAQETRLHYRFNLDDWIDLRKQLAAEIEKYLLYKG